MKRLFVLDVRDKVGADRLAEILVRNLDACTLYGAKLVVEEVYVEDVSQLKIARKEADIIGEIDAIDKCVSENQDEVSSRQERILRLMKKRSTLVEQITWQRATSDCLNH